MRIVLDTNVLVRALLSPNGPATVVLELLEPPHDFVSSLSILDEVSDVLHRDRLRRIHRRDDDAITRYLDNLRSLAGTFVLETTGHRVVPHDPKHDHVITAAILGGADVLVTLDSHLSSPDVLAYCHEHGIRVLTDVELLGELRR